MGSTQKCEICNSVSWKKFSEKLIKCLTCGLLRADEYISIEDAGRIYNDDYFHGKEYSDYLHDRNSLEANFKKRIKIIEDVIGFSNSSLVIEIGCAHGFFLNLIKNKVRKCLGFDMSEEAVDYANRIFGLEARTDDFLSYAGEKADIICMWDVIEHLPNPDEFIKKISEVLRPKGYLCLTTGDSGSFIARLRGDKWRLVHPPTHIFYFSRQTIEKILNKHGFDIIRVSHPSVYRNLGSIIDQIIFKRRKEERNNFILEITLWILKKIKADRINIGLNFFDIMEVIAVKKHDKLP